MKLPFTICGSRFAIWKKSPESAVAGCRACAAGNRKSAIVNLKSRSGIALVITLILLSVTLIMAVAFLAISSRERGSVTTESEATTARLAADAALAHAEAQIMANVLSTTNPYNFGLIVSTNYINPAGFSPGLNNVNYDYTSAAGNPPLTPADFLENLTNLWYLPRAPVFVSQNGAADFRFYLDLNRNGRFDTNGVVGEFDNNNHFLTNSFEVGDPEWIGGLTRPDAPHGPDNQFIYRYAFIALPEGNGLDLNYIHNQVLNQSLGTADGYLRNQGVGSWEINLAAFLADLNTNQWTTYDYLEPAFQNTGIAFDDARALLAYRYANNYNTLASVDGLYGGPLGSGDFEFRNDNIDGYSDGPLQTTLDTNADFFPDNPALPWAGADNANHFFDVTADLFDTTKTESGVTPPGFTDRLLNAGTNTFGGSTVSTYDRYTLYRLLSQLGTDSSAESGKININYDNLDPYIYTSGGITYTNAPSETNFLSWTPLGFFSSAADRMLRAYTANWIGGSTNNFNSFTNTFGANITNAFGVANIPVYVNGQFVYTPAINRLLQLAANIYDASTNSFYPSVFRPMFNVVLENGYMNVYINGYQRVSSVSGTGDTQLVQPVDVTTLSLGASVVNYPNGVNVYGVPWIIGAKKGFPAFNQFSMVNSGQFARRLEVVRATTNGPVVLTNQMVTMSINNNLGISFWNSYSNDYVGSGHLTVYVASTNVILLTNSVLANPYIFSFGTNFSWINFSLWPGSKWSANGGGIPAANSFKSSVWTNNLVSGLAYNFASGGFAGTNNVTAWDPTLKPLPQFGLLTTNYLQAYILDGGHVIDYVQLRGPIDNANLNNALADPNYPDNTLAYYLWSTNVFGNGTVPSWGIENQISISSKPVNPPPSAQWVNTGVNIPGLDPITASRDFFAAAFTPSHSFSTGGKIYYNNQLTNQAPYTASRTILGPVSLSG